MLSEIAVVNPLHCRTGRLSDCLSLARMLRHFVFASLYISPVHSFITIFLRLYIAAWICRNFSTFLSRGHALLSPQSIVPITMWLFCLYLCRFRPFVLTSLRPFVSPFLYFCISLFVSPLDHSIYNFLFLQHSLYWILCAFNYSYTPLLVDLH